MVCQEGYFNDTDVSETVCQNYIEEESSVSCDNSILGNDHNVCCKQKELCRYHEENDEPDFCGDNRRAHEGRYCLTDTCEDSDIATCCDQRQRCQEGLSEH